MNRARQFWILLVGSLVIAAASAGLPYLTDRGDTFLVMKIVLPFCLGWFVFVWIALKQFRWRGLWLLLGAPLTFWWPFLFAMIASACARNIKTCP
jgi:hypothetical protein